MNDEETFICELNRCAVAGITIKNKLMSAEAIRITLLIRETIAENTIKATTQKVVRTVEYSNIERLWPYQVTTGILRKILQ
jgi:hypothetical protein